MCKNDIEWSKKCRERDNNMCRFILPGCHGRANQVHHIFGRKLQAIRLDLDNGLSCCTNCHNIIEKGGEWVDEFIKKRVRPEVWERLINKIEKSYGEGTYT